MKEPKVHNSYAGQPYMTISYYPTLNEVLIQGWYNLDILETARPDIEGVSFEVINMNPKTVTQ